MGNLSSVFDSVMRQVQNFQGRDIEGWDIDQILTTEIDLIRHIVEAEPLL
jgi:hypothetical protein